MFPKLNKISATTPKQTAPTAGEEHLGENKSPTSKPSEHQTIWMLTANQTLEPHLVQIGVTDGRLTEIVSGDVKVGDAVVLGQASQEAATEIVAKQPARPVLVKEPLPQPPARQMKNRSPQGKDLL